jgi:uncharacterized membrane protein YbhN (UPF0104 family)
MADIGTASAAPPQDQPSLPHRIVRILIWLVGLALLGFVLNALGIDISGWFSSLWDTLTSISAGYIVAGVFFQTIQTTLCGVAWYYILQAAYPRETHFWPVLASYSVSTALNGVLPANLGTFTMLLMFLVIIPGSTFAGVFAAYLVQKIFFTVIGALVYLYLFLAVPGSYSIQLGNTSDHPAATVIILAGAIAGIVILCRIFWRWVKKLWLEAKKGGAILARPSQYFLKAFLPQFLGWCAKLCVIGIFLAAYGIPVTFHTIMSIVGSNSIASVTSVTPGGIGVNQAMNAAALAPAGIDSTTAVAYSTAQQLVTTAWNWVMAIVLIVMVFGWSGGKQLVFASYADAKVKAAEQKEEQKRKFQESRERRRREKEEKKKKAKQGGSA